MVWLKYTKTRSWQQQNQDLIQIIVKDFRIYKIRWDE